LARQQEERVVIAAAHQTMLAPPALPYDAEVEWLVNATSINQVGSVACVDTGIDSGDNVGFEVDVTRVNETRGDCVIFGSRYSSGDTRYFVGAQSGGKYYWGWNGRLDSQTLTLNAKHTLGLNYLNSRTATFDGTQVGSLSGTYTNAKRLYFCAYNTQVGSIGGSSSWRCHGGRISVGSIIVRRYKPVRIGATGYWYEEISGTLHAAQDGAFVVGPDKT
jgi:hypothetical protein